MGDTWMKYIAKIDTFSEKEHCSICWKTDCDLYGKYGTYNAPGSFKGICIDCLNNILELKGGNYVKDN